MKRWKWFVLSILVLSAACAHADEAQVDFNLAIRPILSDKCFVCHGPNDEDRQAELRLDQKDSALGETLSGARPIIPGKPDESEIVRRITSDDADLVMPPPDTNKSLTAEEIEVIKRWIAEGAPWEDLWSLRAPKRPPIPSVNDEAWAQTPIDRFVLARLEQEGMRPSPQAEKITLIRRVSFDLTGLPPTPQEVDAFLADQSPDAYEKVVDRLLGSQRYGEHMARFWLDAARYGDTHGLHLDNYREIWPYRDWVVNAFNRNQPFDQFAIEQLAGDLLPEPTREQQIATGFNRCNVTTNEGGSIEEEVYVRNVVDRVVTFGTVFMGATFECARCHDHKFDPYTMEDFYSLFAYFNSIDGGPMDGNRKDHAPVLRVSTDAQQEQLAELDRQIAALEQRLNEPWPEIDALQQAWSQQLAEKMAAPEDDESSRLALGDWYTVGPFSENRRYLFSKKHGPEGKPVNLEQEFSLATGAKAKWEPRPEWKDGTVHGELPGELSANFLHRTITSPSARKVTISLGSDDAIKVYLNNRQVHANDVARGVAPDQDTVELSLEEGKNDLLVKIMNYGGASGFYFAVQSATETVPEEILEIVRLAEDERSPEQQTKLRKFYRDKVATADALKKARDEQAELRKQRAEVDRQIPTTLIWREAKEAKPAFFLKRGEYDQRGDAVSRRTPTALPPMDPDLPNDRMGLARWLVDPSHPLTARVTMNRFWQQVFGAGIVETAEDFGSQGTPPTHAKLLDWLAVEFIESGWDVKAMMRKIVTSATYRQSSHVTPESYARDPANRLLGRGPRFRLDAEMLRDQALFVGGLLVDVMGGPSVKPPQPDGLWFAVGYSGSNTVRFKADSGRDKVHRRTLYTFIKRTAPPPQMSTFDGPSREACTVRRERTNTPLQSLLLFNDPQYVEAARALAERTMRHGGSTDAERAAYMFRLCLLRPAGQQELDELVQGHADDLQAFRADDGAARKLVEVGELPVPDDLDACELAAWTMTANLLLNLDELVTKN